MVRLAYDSKDGNGKLDGGVVTPQDAIDRSISRTLTLALNLVKLKKAAAQPEARTAGNGLVLPATKKKKTADSDDTEEEEGPTDRQGDKSYIDEDGEDDGWTSGDDGEARAEEEQRSIASSINEAEKSE